MTTADPTPPPTFAALGLAKELLDALRDAGYEHPTPIQADAIPLAMAGRDLIGLAQTGTGKTAGFTLPILNRLMGGPRRTRALVLTPTRELCLQVEESVRKYSHYAPLDVIPVFGGVSYEPQEKALRSGVDIVVATPGRLIDQMDRRNVDFSYLEVLVLDEADRMLDMGFAPQIQKVIDQLPRYRQTMLFSATMPPEVEALGRKYLRRPVVVQVGRRSAAAATVTHAVYPVRKERKTDLLANLLSSSPHESVLVFTRTKHGADKIERELQKRKISAAAMHADKSQPQRIRALEDFRSGKIRVLVATDIAQRGLDIDGISHVVNFDVPQAPEDYVHRIGRTGRAATTGDAYTFMSPDEIGMVRTIERELGQENPRISVPGFDFGTAAPAKGTPTAAPAAKASEKPAAKAAAKPADKPADKPTTNGAAPDRPKATHDKPAAKRAPAKRSARKRASATAQPDAAAATAATAAKKTTRKPAARKRRPAAKKSGSSRS